ncbi:MAG: hypothetical protein NT051_04775 [Candidatus Micrarchaeota archaeon]|nr:hypothetical protein [Candidatus Micrarchaeota archaeon]
MAGENEAALVRKLGETFEPAIAAKIAEFGGLLTREAAAALLCSQHGISFEKEITLSQAKSTRELFSFRAKVDRIFPIQKFEGNFTRLVRLYLSDRTGKGTLVLWNEQTATVKGAIATGDIVECHLAYFRAGEICISRAGTIVAAEKFAVSELSGLGSGVCSVKGIVREKKDGEWPLAFSFLVCQGKTCVRAVAWRGQIEGLDEPVDGDEIILENAFFKNNEINIGEGSRILIAGKQGSEGVLEDVCFENGGLAFIIGKEKFAAPLEQGFGMLGIRALPQGVQPATVAKLKAMEVAGMRVLYSFNERKIAWLEVIEEKKKEEK